MAQTLPLPDESTFFVTIHYELLHLTTGLSNKVKILHSSHRLIWSWQCRTPWSTYWNTWSMLAASWPLPRPGLARPPAGAREARCSLVTAFLGGPRAAELTQGCQLAFCLNRSSVEASTHNNTNPTKIHQWPSLYCQTLEVGGEPWLCIVANGLKHMLCLPGNLKTVFSDSVHYLCDTDKTSVASAGWVPAAKWEVTST